MAISCDDARRLMDGSFEGILALPERLAMSIHKALGERGVAGGAVYDGLVALAARANGATLATRDARARATYEALEVDIELIRSTTPTGGSLGSARREWLSC
jgi:predicted nucleic acid-binding protein